MEELTVGGNLVIKPGMARSISAFSEISAFSMSAPQMTVGFLFIAGNAGVTVSSDKLGDSSNPPLRLGNWSFPNSGGNAPEFKSLKIMALSSADIGELLTHNRHPMTKLTSKGWKSAEVQK
jgi:hypothetical protein